MKYQNVFLTLLLATALSGVASARTAPALAPAYLRSQISGIHRLDSASITKLAELIKRLPASTKHNLTSFAHDRLKKVSAHPLKGNILIGDIHKVTQENLTQLVTAIAQ